MIHFKSCFGQCDLIMKHITLVISKSKNWEQKFDFSIDFLNWIDHTHFYLFIFPNDTKSKQLATLFNFQLLVFFPTDEFHWDSPACL